MYGGVGREVFDGVGQFSEEDLSLKVLYNKCERSDRLAA